MAAARQRLLRPEVRLLTLTGPPGVGKTDARLVIDAIARGLGLREVDRRVTPGVVQEFLRDKSLLLILDNFEQVLDAADDVGRLLAAGPRLKVVATSRAPLHLRWEHELPVPPLTFPDLADRPGADAVAASPAGQLFIERAQAVAPDFLLGHADAAAVAEICAYLDGLPLAIELAAARIKLFPPRALLRRLVRARQGEASEDSPLRLLADQTRDLPPRQQTLLRAIAWSYDLLDQNEQALFRRLSVFLGGCSVEAAETVGGFGMRDGLDVVASLVDKSLVWREEQSDGEPRLRMLETIREYGGSNSDRARMRRRPGRGTPRTTSTWPSARRSSSSDRTSRPGSRVWSTSATISGPSSAGRLPGVMRLASYGSGQRCGPSGSPAKTRRRRASVSKPSCR